jgi:hypothetical protein
VASEPTSKITSKPGADVGVRLIALFLGCALPLLCQSNRGELRLKVTDPSGLGLKATVEIVSEANQYHNSLATTDQGILDLQHLPFGLYQLEINQPGFASVAHTSPTV